MNALSCDTACDSYADTALQDSSPHRCMYHTQLVIINHVRTRHPLWHPYGETWFVIPRLILIANPGSSHGPLGVGIKILSRLDGSVPTLSDGEKTPWDPLRKCQKKTNFENTVSTVLERKKPFLKSQNIAAKKISYVEM